MGRYLLKNHKTEQPFHIQIEYKRQFVSYFKPFQQKNHEKTIVFRPVFGVFPFSTSL